MNIKARLIAIGATVAAFFVTIFTLVLKNKITVAKLEKKHEKEVKQIYENEKERREIKETLGKGNSSERINATADVVRKLSERTK